MIGLIVFLFGRIWTLVLWVMKTVECFKHCLMGHTSRSMEASGAECNLMNCLQLDQEVTDYNMLPRDRSCDILVKKVAVLALVQRVYLR